MNKKQFANERKITYLVRHVVIHGTCCETLSNEVVIMMKSGHGEQWKMRNETGGDNIQHEHFM